MFYCDAVDSLNCPRIRNNDFVRGPYVNAVVGRISRGQHVLPGHKPKVMNTSRLIA